MQVEIIEQDGRLFMEPTHGRTTIINGERVATMTMMQFVVAAFGIEDDDEDAGEDEDSEA